MLAGKRDPLDLLFSTEGGAHGAYRGSPLARHLNQAAAAIVAGARPRRVIEIGGGTAATTRALRDVLPNNIDYLFTDISPAFLTAAQRALADWPALRTATLDISRDRQRRASSPAPSMWWLLRTSSTQRPISRRRSATPPACLPADGSCWWKGRTAGATRHHLRLDRGLRTQRTDHAVRPNHPLVDLETWRRLLQQAGLAQTVVVAEGSGQIVLTATGNAPRWVAIGADKTIARDVGLDWLPALPDRPIDSGVVFLDGLQDGASALPSLLQLSQALLRRPEAPRLWPL